MIGCFFFFKQKTAYEMRISDWSSDVCSSDLAELGSTNDWLADAARQGAPEGQWVRADRQTGGRGRRGRTWVSEPGNLYASTLIRLRGGDPPAQQLGFVAALALHRALRSEEHTSELQSLMRISYAVFCLKKKKFNRDT